MLKTSMEDMKTRKRVQSGRLKRAGGRRSSEPAPTSKRPRRQPVKATEQQHSSRQLTTENIPELVKVVVEAMPSQPVSASRLQGLSHRHQGGASRSRKIQRISRRGTEMRINWILVSTLSMVTAFFAVNITCY